MDRQRLEYFLVVAETGSIRRAAELLRLTPAALSKACKLLSDEVGFELLIPDGRGVLVSTKGRVLADQAKPIIQKLRAIPELIRTEKDYKEQKQIKIATFEVFSTHFLSHLFNDLPNNIDLILRELEPGELESAIKENIVDYGITYIPIPTSGVEHFKIKTIQMGIYASKKFCEFYKNTRLEEIPFVIPVQPLTGTPSKVIGLDGWPDDKLQRYVKYKVNLMESALEICKLDKAAAYLPRFVVNLHNQKVQKSFKLENLQNIKSPKNNLQDVFLIKRKSDIEDPIFKKISKSIRQIDS